MTAAATVYDLAGLGQLDRRLIRVRPWRNGERVRVFSRELRPGVDVGQVVSHYGRHDYALCSFPVPGRHRDDQIELRLRELELAPAGAELLERKSDPELRAAGEACAICGWVPDPPLPLWTRHGARFQVHYLGGGFEVFKVASWGSTNRGTPDNAHFVQTVSGTRESTGERVDFGTEVLEQLRAFEVWT